MVKLQCNAWVLAARYLYVCQKAGMQRERCSLVACQCWSPCAGGGHHTVLLPADLTPCCVGCGAEGICWGCCGNARCCQIQTTSLLWIQRRALAFLGWGLVGIPLPNSVRASRFCASKRLSFGNFSLLILTGVCADSKSVPPEQGTALGQLTGFTELETWTSVTLFGPCICLASLSF